MSPEEKRTEDWSPDVARVSQEIASRLQTRGISVQDGDSPDDLRQLLERVEEFEEVVLAGGGDLMVDEPPSRSAPQPDDRRFLLPKRGDDESVSNFLKRLQAATEAARNSL